MALFHLVRHAAHDLLGRVLVGRGPVDINAQGRQDAASLARGLAASPLAGIFCSPQQRAIQTAAAISAAVGLPVQIDAGLDEIDMGDWTGAGFDSLRHDPRWQTFNAFRGSTPAAGGEAMLQVQCRAMAVLQRLRAAEPNGAFVLVSHADVIRAVLVHCLAMPLDFIGRLDVAPASRSVVEFWDAAVVVRAVNLPPEKEAVLF